MGLVARWKRLVMDGCSLVGLTSLLGLKPSVARRMAEVMVMT